MKALLSAVVLLGSVVFACGASQQFTFALPELDGRISLGVFDSGDKLVRTLAVSATEADFTVGLNGLTATWDGRDDAGKAQPAGKYTVRGFVVGKGLKSEGEAYHFNDWVDSEETAQFQPRRVAGAKGEEVVLTGVAGAPPVPATFRYTEADGLRRIEEKAPGPDEAVWRGRLYRVSQNGVIVGPIKVFRMEGMIPDGEIASPKDIRLLDANEAALIVSDTRSVWLYRGNTFEQVQMAGDLEISALSAGVGQTFWIEARLSVAGVRGPLFVQQYAFNGEILRELKSGVEGEGTIYADKTEERIFISQDLPIGSLVRGLRPVAGGISLAADQRTADWEIFLDKAAEACGNFGWVEGKLVSDAGGAPQNDRQKVVMAASSLTAKLQAVVLQAKVTEGQVWLQTADGLRLSLLGKLPGGERCILVPEGGNSFRVFVGNGVVVAEYLVTGLKQIAEIDAGEIALP